MVAAKLWPAPPLFSMTIGWPQSCDSRWLTARDGTGDSFVSRAVYGEYLQTLLRDALGEGGHPGRLLLEQDEAVALDLTENRPVVRLALGRRLPADAVVLATGLGLPAAPSAACEGAGPPVYFADPWRLDPATAPAGMAPILTPCVPVMDVPAGVAAAWNEVCR